MISIVTICLIILEVTNAFTPTKLVLNTRNRPSVINPQPKELRRNDGSARRRGDLSLSNDGLTIIGTDNNTLVGQLDLADTRSNDIVADVNMAKTLEVPPQKTVAETASEGETSMAEDVIKKPLELPSSWGGDDTIADEVVRAVLAASGEAVAAAEASMPQDLMEKLDFASLGSNGSITSTPFAVEEAPEILPASPVVAKPVTATKIKEIKAPSVSKIIKFAIPAIGVWLCGPILSLIDTSSVGLLCGTAQQAALSPAAAVTDYAALLIVSVDSDFSRRRIQLRVCFTNRSPPLF
jgi:hypothetical protein